MFIQTMSAFLKPLGKLWVFLCNTSCTSCLRSSLSTPSSKGYGLLIPKSHWEGVRPQCGQPNVNLRQEDLNIYQNSVVIFDRGYYSEDMFRYCVKHQHLCLMRLKQNYNIAKKCSGDIITVLPGNEKDGTEDTNIRVIEVILNDGTKEYLATNLFDSHISQQMFRELYFYRWPVETKYKELKSRLAIEEFSGATTTSVLQEFYINVLLSNLSSLIKNQVDEEIQITAKSTNKYRYQANRAFIIGRIKTIVPKILCNLFDLSAIDRLYKESLRCRSQIMPGRTFRRKKNKAIGRTHFNNKKVAF